MLIAMVVTELAATDEFAELREAYRRFMDAHVYAAEPGLAREDEAADALIADLRARAKAEGLWAPHLPPAAGGTGRAAGGSARAGGALGALLGAGGAWGGAGGGWTALAGGFGGDPGSPCDF